MLMLGELGKDALATIKLADLPDDVAMGERAEAAGREGDEAVLAYLMRRRGRDRRRWQSILERDRARR